MLARDDSYHDADPIRTVPHDELAVDAARSRMPGVDGGKPPAWRKPVAVYDGACDLCCVLIEWCETRMRRPVQVIPLQDDDLMCEAPNVDLNKVKVEFAFQEWDGRVYYGAPGIARLFARLHQPWELLGRLAMLPPLTQLLQIGYDLLSKHRSKVVTFAKKLGADWKSDVDDLPGRRRYPETVK